MISSIAIKAYNPLLKPSAVFLSSVRKGSIRACSSHGFRSHPTNSNIKAPKRKFNMGKNNKKSMLPEELLLLPVHPSRTSTPPTAIIDTHTHLMSTFEAYRKHYKNGKFDDVWAFSRAMFQGRDVEAIVDVWCEAPVRKKEWKTLVDSAGSKELWGGTEYWFVMGVHPHQAKLYTDEVENDILEAMAHPRCVGWGEIGLDYHYDNSPREIQQQVLVRQLRQAVRLNKPITIHTREAEEDTEKILKEEVPKDHRVHIHCFTDSPEWAGRMLDHFPNLFIGITGVITYSTNLNTSATIRQMLTSPSSPNALRIILETDAPYMVPSNLNDSVPAMKNKRVPLSHSAMIPWTADFVAQVANSAIQNGEQGGEEEKELDIWDVERVMKVGRDNARKMYGV